jgi:hypothetical protein
VIRQLDAAPRAFEERDAELQLEVAHLPGQRRLRDAKPGRGARESPCLGNSDEVAQMAKLHQAMPNRHGL